MNLILEKDHRQKMIKFGISKEVAEYLHEFNDKYSIWFADQFKKSPQFQQSRDQLNFLNNKRTQMQSIVDWIRNDQNLKLKDYTFDEALAKSIEYHENLEITTIGDVEKNKIIKTYRDGFYWADLEETYSSEEAGCMGHCGRTEADTLYSLRKINPIDKTFECFITLAISPDNGQWLQCKGKRNSKPKSEYFPYIVDILIASNVFKHKNEYDAERDFNAMDFKEYVEENKAEIENADEILEKIDGNMIKFSQFEEALKAEEIQGAFYVDIYEEDDGSVSEQQGFYEEFSYEELEIDANMARVIASISHSQSHLQNILNDGHLLPTMEFNVSEIEWENYVNEKKLKLRVNSEYNYYKRDEDGLRSFEESITRFQKIHNDNYEREKFLKNFDIILDIYFENDFEQIQQFATRDGELANLNCIMPARTSYRRFEIRSNEIPFQPTLDRQAMVSRVCYIKSLTSGYITSISKNFPLLTLVYLFVQELKTDASPEFSNNWMVEVNAEGIIFSKTYEKEILDADSDETREVFDFEKEREQLKKIDELLPWIEKKIAEFQRQILNPIVDAKEKYTVNAIKSWKKTSYDHIWELTFKDGYETEIAISHSTTNQYHPIEYGKYHIMRDSLESGEMNEFSKQVISSELHARPIYKYPTMKYELKDYDYYIDQIRSMLTGQMMFKFESFQEFFQKYYLS